ncbi:hypothetical protein L873DRAFT_1274821 [Choiromyces venosus 120613-1]|uniref:Uncharacterized protein n=1 Tax=Choiromyces venosus 120613-1 TaxID=1336337 RepID=A0A3N4K220_9PEZI|nr:hypothetical protein L873DRAFT_1274821 [Choiromyces venosus 120613-1]
MPPHPGAHRHHYHYHHHPPQRGSNPTEPACAKSYTAYSANTPATSWATKTYRWSGSTPGARKSGIPKSGRKWAGSASALATACSSRVKDCVCRHHQWVR